MTPEKERILTASTLISFSRVILVIPIGMCLMSSTEYGRFWAAGIAVAAVGTDFLDGFLARRWHQVTEVGKIVDPLADKAGVAALAILLVILGDLPLWYFVVVVLRDALILAGGIYIRQTKKIVPQSNWPGKIAVSVIAAVLFLSILRLASLEALREYAIWLSIAVMVLSLVTYAKRLVLGRAGWGR